MVVVVVLNEMCELCDGFDWCDVIEIEYVFGFGQCGKCVFEYCCEELFFVVEVVIEYVFVGFGLVCDLIDVCVEQFFICEFFGCCYQDVVVCIFRIFFDFWLIYGGVLLCELFDLDWYFYCFGVGCFGMGVLWMVVFLLSFCKKVV